MIIDNAQDDVATLTCCALVAHSWLLRSRIHLFAEVAIRVEDQLDGFMELINTGVHIAGSILSLRLTSDVAGTMAPASFSLLISSLPSIDTLEFSNVCFVPATGAVAQKRWPSHLSVLLFEGLSMPVQDVVKMLSTFACIDVDSLWLRDCVFVEDDSDDKPHPAALALTSPTSWKIGELSIQLSSCEVLVSHILSCFLLMKSQPQALGSTSYSAPSRLNVSFVAIAAFHLLCAARSYPTTQLTRVVSRGVDRANELQHTCTCLVLYLRVLTPLSS